MAKSQLSTEMRQALRAELGQEQQAFTQAKIKVSGGDKGAIQTMKKHAERIQAIKAQLKG